MNVKNIGLRIATPNDAEALLEIYAPYVMNTAVSFEYNVPSVSEFRKRISNTLMSYPYIAASYDDHLVGYAYTSPFIGRAAYNWSAETSIYVNMDFRRRGIGIQLYRTLEKISKAQNILNLNACIAHIEQEDEYLTNDSTRFHARMGYKMVGKFHNSGYKFGRWYDMIWMEKEIAPHCSNPLPVIPFRNINASTLCTVFSK